MISYLLAGAAEEPVSLAEAKAFLRLDADAEDGLVTTLIAAARLHVEAVTGRALVTQSWRLVLDAWPADGTVTVPVSPVIAVAAIRVFDQQDDEHEVALDGLQVEPGRVLLPDPAVLPVLRRRLAVEIDYDAGYGEPAAVPADLKRALLALVAHWFEQRDVAVAEAVAPAGFDRLVAGYRQVRL
ncbi:head-tail connector protein [Devosia sp.]|uniref:head-tail connector protein n=1 Tax=Devosia sp. TaxID=1871048 RepID=UPI001AC6F6BA|nr:head-tail connector protein [Devosia sp.]MBN9308140.1 phage head-tail connector protein [Devosia sp.]